MKQTPLTLAINRAIQIKLKAVDRLMKELVEPLEDVGNPEKLIGKKYEDWTAEDLNLLSKIYGTKEPNLLSNLLERKLIDEVIQLEQEER